MNNGLENIIKGLLNLTKTKTRIGYSKMSPKNNTISRQSKISVILKSADYNLPRPKTKRSMIQIIIEGEDLSNGKKK